MNERRDALRVVVEGVRARIRPGHRLIVLNVSARGALVEGPSGLRPGSRIEVQIESEVRRDTVAARVMRCGVVAIHPEGGVTYRAALAFNEACDWVREVTTRSGYALPGDAPAGTGSDGAVLPVVSHAEQK